MRYYTSINEGLFDRFKKKPKPIDKPAPKENVAEKYKFMDDATKNKVKNDILRELIRICKRYKDILGNDDPEIVLEDPNFICYQILFNDEDEIDIDKYYDIRDQIQDELEKSSVYQKYAGEGYDIEIATAGDVRDSIYVNINERLYCECLKQKRNRDIDPKLKTYFETANIFESCEFI